ncbi:hypothetical protein GD604_04545 [Desulfolutivibrio sulfoxidireducens]|nr:hypothetical protein GD604_04545 [Desulfolutivibrio sulfoxidireducens]
MIEKNRENAMRCNPFLANGAYTSLPMACMGKNAVLHVFDSSPTGKRQSAAVRRVHFASNRPYRTVLYAFSVFRVSSNPPIHRFPRFPIAEFLSFW